MKHLVLMVCLLCPGFTVIAQVPPTDSQVGDILFQMPSGWQRSDQGVRTFVVPATAADNLSTYIELAGFDLGNNSLQDAFNAQIASVLRFYQVLSHGQTGSQHSDNGFDFYYTTAAVADQQGKRWAVAMFGAQYQQKMEIVLFMTSEVQPQVRDSYMQALQGFLSSVRFGPPHGSRKPSAKASGASGPASGPTAASSGNPPASGSGRSIERDMSLPPSGPMSFNHLPTAPGKFNGIFRAPVPQGTDLTGTLDFADPSKNTPDFQYLVLFSDGTALRGLPTMGLSALKASVRLDIAAGGNTCAKWGVYRMAGNQGQVVFANPKVAGQQLVMNRFVGDAWNIQEYADHLVINGNTYTMMDGGISGKKLVGTYKPLGDAGQPGITFTAEGEFDDQGIMKKSATAIGIVGGGLAIGYAFNSPGPGRGTYHITNYTLDLHYSSGQNPPVLFWIDPQSPDAQVIYLGNVKFKRVK